MATTEGSAPPPSGRRLTRAAQIIVISSVSVGKGAQDRTDPLARMDWKDSGAVAICTLTTLYFFGQNLRGIHEACDEALSIMFITSVMGVVMLAWCGLTPFVQGPAKYEVK